MRHNHPLVLAYAILAEMGKTKKRPATLVQKQKETLTRAEDGKLQMKALRLQMNPETSEKKWSLVAIAGIGYVPVNQLCDVIIPMKNAC